MKRLAAKLIVVLCLFLTVLLAFWSASRQKPAPPPAPKAPPAVKRSHAIRVHGTAIVVPTPDHPGLAGVIPDEREEGLERICFKSIEPNRILFFAVREIDADGAATDEEFDAWKAERVDGFFLPEKLRPEEIPPHIEDQAGNAIPLHADEIFPQHDARSFLTTESPVSGGGYAGHMIVTRMLLRESPIAICAMSLAKDGKAEDVLPQTLAWREAIIKAAETLITDSQEP